jgi:hypothetical protein
LTEGKTRIYHREERRETWGMEWGGTVNEK